MCDFEGAFNTLSTAFAKQAWDWIAYVKQKTGKYRVVWHWKRILYYPNDTHYSEHFSRAEMNWQMLQIIAPLEMIKEADDEPSRTLQ